MQIGLAEFLQKVGKLKKKEEKIQALKMNESFPLLTVLQGIYDPRVQFDLPDTDPPYKVNDVPDQEHVLIRESKKLGYFVKGANNLPTAKREQMYIELLERCAPDDAKLLLGIKNKKYPFKGITEDIVREAFPNLLPERKIA
jgi:Family of unknown function (DUF6433)